jgi:beta-lactamase regulating signal transducer with metallopeptidase domain
MIADLVIEIVRISFFTSLLIGVLLLMTPILHKRYRARWRYVVWLVIAARLLVPVNIALPQTPIKIELPAQAESVLSSLASINQSYFAHEFNYNNITTPEASGVISDLRNFEMSESITTPSVVPYAYFSPMQIVGYIWVVGMLVFMFAHIYCYRFFLRSVEKCCKDSVPPHINALLLVIGEEMGIRRLPKVVITNAVRTPVLTGILFSRLLLPHTEYTDEDIAFIIRHELVHYRRKDMWYKLVLMLANACHWFNPLVYLMNAQASKDIELACDDDTVRSFDFNARSRYGNAILSAIPMRTPAISTNFGSGKNHMKNRLQNLFDTSTKRRGIIALGAIAVIALLATTVADVDYTAQDFDDQAHLEKTANAIELSSEEPRIINRTLINNVKQQTIVEGEGLNAIYDVTFEFSYIYLGMSAFQSGDSIRAEIHWDDTVEGEAILFTSQKFLNLYEVTILASEFASTYNAEGMYPDTTNMEKFFASHYSPVSIARMGTNPGDAWIYFIVYDNPEHVYGSIERVSADGGTFNIWEHISERGDTFRLEELYTQFEIANHEESSHRPKPTVQDIFLRHAEIMLNEINIIDYDVNEIRERVLQNYSLGNYPFGNYHSTDERLIESQMAADGFRKTAEYFGISFQELVDILAEDDIIIPTFLS